MEFEEGNENEKQESIHKHHEDNFIFQNDFFNDVDKLSKGFICNSFQMQNLTVADNTETVFDDNIYYNISRLESTGFSQLQEFNREHLTLSKVSINTKITKKHFILLGGGLRGSMIDHCLNLPFLTKFRSAITNRRIHTQKLFATELFGTSQCLSIDHKTLYHGTKADILRRYEKVSYPEISSSSAIIVELR